MAGFSSTLGSLHFVSNLLLSQLVDRSPLLELRAPSSSTMGHRPQPTWLLFTEDPYKILHPPPGPIRRIKEYEVGLTFIRCCISSFSIAAPHMYERVDVTEQLGKIQGNCKMWKKRYVLNIIPHLENSNIHTQI